MLIQSSVMDYNFKLNSVFLSSYKALCKLIRYRFFYFEFNTFSPELTVTCGLIEGGGTGVDSFFSGSTISTFATPFSTGVTAFVAIPTSETWNKRKMGWETMLHKKRNHSFHRKSNEAEVLPCSESKCCSPFQCMSRWCVCSESERATIEFETRKNWEKRKEKKIMDWNYRFSCW